MSQQIKKHKFSTKITEFYRCKKCGCELLEDKVNLYDDRWCNERYLYEDAYAFCNNCGELSEEDVELVKLP